MNVHLTSVCIEVTSAFVQPEPALHAPPMYTPVHFTPCVFARVLASVIVNAVARSTPRRTVIVGVVELPEPTPASTSDATPASGPSAAGPPSSPIMQALRMEATRETNANRNMAAHSARSGPDRLLARHASSHGAAPLAGGVPRNRGWAVQLAVRAPDFAAQAS